MGSHNLVIVANRLPVTVKRVDGKIVYEVSNGGLPTAMSSLDVGGAKRMWIGWPGIGSDDLTHSEKQSIVRTLNDTYGCYPVFLTNEQVHLFYEGYCNDTLWPLFHYFPDSVTYKEEYWQSYKAVNDLFRRAIMRQSAPDAAIWIHDYHFLLLPALVRSGMPRASIGFFLHTPFPSFEIFRQLPHRRELLEGLLGSDLIGFHIYDYARHFLSSVLRLLGHEHHRGSFMVGARTIKVDVFPIGIDYQRFKGHVRSDEVRHEIEILDKHYVGQKVILSMDRLDFSKGILNRLDAYEQFLQKYPHHIKKVVLMMVAVPSRTEIETYRELREEVERRVGQINGAYGTVDWVPISYQFKNLPFSQIVAMFVRADVALVTPLRDGMNLVAKEYVASKQSRSGVLILSEMVGASDELSEAIQVNPNDRSSMVRALHMALRMSVREKKRRLRLMHKRLATYTVQRWAEDFMDQLHQTKQLQAQHGRKMLTATTQLELLQDFRRAKKRLFCLDYDGTLRSYVKSSNPNMARPTKEIMQMLHGLCQLTGTKVYIISGRQHTVLDEWFSSLPIGLIAEHSAWVKTTKGWQQTGEDFAGYKDKIRPLLRYYAERTPGAEIDEKTFAIVWHYRNVPTELAYARNAALRHELNQIVGDSDVEIRGGQKIIEIKPRSIQKGYAVRDIVNEYQPDFVFIAGDDYTDEDMFQIAPHNAHTLKVGLGETSARHQITSVKGVMDVLKALMSSDTDEVPKAGPV